ncbi:cytochrome c oxidase copper chaperone-like [Salvia splendens]|uniref:cytochrome c oxidase copper chaperone-like n=1 Tax=Salvia splendens TaxID=180675 RepID=UPI001C2806B4|nr:cytochrome c oxidase copper chaperone-like [Salvia splendens]
MPSYIFKKFEHFSLWIRLEILLIPPLNIFNMFSNWIWFWKFSLGRIQLMGAGSSSQNSSPVVSIKSLDDQGSAPDVKPKKKICCACPDTKKLRDECIVEHGESACEKWIEAHRKCLRAEGFNV